MKSEAVFAVVVVGCWFLLVGWSEKFDEGHWPKDFVELLCPQ